MSGNPADYAIKFCTHLIESKQYSGKQLGMFYMQRGWLELGRDNYQIAIGDLSETLNLNPDPYPAERYAKTYRCRARALANIDLADALRDCTEAIPDSPLAMRNFRALVARGMVHLRLKRYREALEDLQKANYRWAEYHYLRSLAHAGAGNKAEAEADLALAMKNDRAVVAKLVALGFK